MLATVTVRLSIYVHVEDRSILVEDSAVCPVLQAEPAESFGTRLNDEVAQLVGSFAPSWTASNPCFLIFLFVQVCSICVTMESLFGVFLSFLHYSSSYTYYNFGKS